tara:strand:- start:334 stop:690 length:357 start_codon:yes stop_codon:yes gene_type:complete
MILFKHSKRIIYKLEQEKKSIQELLNTERHKVTKLNRNIQIIQDINKENKEAITTQEAIIKDLEDTTNRKSKEIRKVKETLESMQQESIENKAKYQELDKRYDILKSIIQGELYQLER